MATPTITAKITPPQPPKSQEITKDAPFDPESQNEDLLNRYGKKLIDLISKKRTQWEWKRRGIVLKTLKNKEMLKGNQHIGAYPGTFDTFDAMEEYWNWAGSDEKNGDRSIDRRPHNFYQMIEKAFVAALSAQTPKQRWTPANADVEEDRETAKIASRAEEIIERANKVKSMLRQELMEFFTSGCYFKYTRYVVDADRTGTHKQTVFQMAKAEVLPARYQCFNCGQTTPEDALVAQRKLACPNCGSPLGPDNYFESHVDEIPLAEQKEDVPNGMVLWDVYGPMHMDADPDAADLSSTPLLNCAVEVPLGWLRTTFQDNWEKFEEGANSGTGSELLDRQYRDMLTTPQGYATWFSFSSQNKPTYNRTWVQPMLFAEMDEKIEALELMKAFPKGCMIAWTGDLPLQIRACKLTDEWTWAGTEQKGFGLFPPPVGDPAVPIQERINDCINKIDEYMDRLACGILLANEGYVDTRALNGKPMLPGVLNPVTFRKGAGPASIQEAIFQVRAEIDAMIFQYVAQLKQDMELLVGTPPQTFGAGTQEGVETMGGQQQQLNTGMMKLGLHWEVIGDEHAEAAENAMKCASDNMTDDWFQSVSDESKDFRNEYVHLDQMKGTVHAERDTDQGFPMTAAEIRQFWQDVVTNPENPFTQMILSEPENVDNAIRFIGVPGLKAPKGAMRGKMLRIISMLVNSGPQQMPDPETGEPIQAPSVMPNKYLDDLDTLIKLIPAWSEEHWDQLEENQPGIDNLVAFYKMCVVYQHEIGAETQMAGGTPPPGQPAPAGA